MLAPTLRKSTRERIEEAERERQLIQQVPDCQCSCLQSRCRLPLILPAAAVPFLLQQATYCKAVISAKAHAPGPFKLFAYYGQVCSLSHIIPLSHTAHGSCMLHRCSAKSAGEGVCHNMCKS